MDKEYIEPLKELNAIKSQVDQLQTQIDMKLDPPDTAFNDTFQPFVVSGAPIINNALELGNTVKSQYIEVSEYLYMVVNSGALDGEVSWRG